jgi:hypothetical protein
MSYAAASPAELSQLQAGVQQLEAYMRGQVARVIAARYAFWQALRAQASQSLLEQLVGPELVTLNAQADHNAAEFGKLLRGLDSGELKLAAWTQQSESGATSPLQLGIVRQGTDPGQLGQWQLLAPIIVRTALQATVAVGSWVLANAWLTSKQLEAQADKVKADTASKITAAVSSVAKQDPAAARALADALGKANDAANSATPGLLDQIGGALRDVTQTMHDVGAGVRESGGEIVFLLLAWLVYKAFSGRRAA